MQHTTRLSFALIVLPALLFCCAPLLSAQSLPSPKDVVSAMVAKELEAAAHKPVFGYMSVERSERTGNHSWTEHVVETSAGRVRFLMAEDGKALSAERMASERGRLAADVRDPSAFEARERSEKDDEAHARQMLKLLPRAFVLENLREDGSDWRIDFRPAPGFSPTGIQEKVLYGMTGELRVDRAQLRLHSIEAHMPQDVSIGFGLLATIHAGSSFRMSKAVVSGQWRTVHVSTDIRGKAALFKTIAKNQDVTRTDFNKLESSPSLSQAVAMAEEPVPQGR